MSLRRYSEDWEGPHGILLARQLIYDPFEVVLTYRLAWLKRPFPRRMGMMEVDAVLNEMTRPLPEKGCLGGGRWFW